MAGRRTFRMLTSSQQSGIKVKYSKTHTLQQYSQNDNSTLKAAIPVPSRQLQQYTQVN